MGKHIRDFILELHVVNPLPVGYVEYRNVLAVGNSHKAFLISAAIDTEDLISGVQVDNVLS